MIIRNIIIFLFLNDWKNLPYYDVEEKHEIMRSRNAHEIPQMYE